MSETSSSSAFSLAPPDAPPLVDAETSMAQVRAYKALTPQEVTTIQGEVDNVLSGTLDLDPKDPRFKEIADEIATWGAKEISATSQVSNRILERPAVEAGSTSPQTHVATTLGELRVQVTELDPNRSDLSGTKKLLKWLPGGNKIDAYFNRYRSAQDHLNAITRALDSGQDELRKDNAAIKIERQNLWDGMVLLRKIDEKIDIADKIVSSKIEEARSSGNAEVVTALESDVLFYVRQRREDLLTQAVVNAQGILALDLVSKNNVELIRGVTRAKETTLSALRIAVIVSGALAQQALVLNQIKGLEETTNHLTAGVSEALKVQGVEIQRQASQSGVSLDTLRKSFADIEEAFVSIDAFKAEANKNRDASIKAIKTQMEGASSLLERSGRESGFKGAVTDTQAAAVNAPAPARQIGQTPASAPAPAKRKMPWE